MANIFLDNGGTVGAVIPINVLRGRESNKVRSILFEEWTPKYILKPTVNYGFLEWSEYRDIILVAQKKKPKSTDLVKFCLIKKDLTAFNENDPIDIAEKILNNSTLRSDDIDINSYPLQEIKEKFDNLMFFATGTDFNHRDKRISFIQRYKDKLDSLPSDYFKEGFQPRPEGVSKFLFLTRFRPFNNK